MYKRLKVSWKSGGSNWFLQCLPVIGEPPSDSGGCHWIVAESLVT